MHIELITVLMKDLQLVFVLGHGAVLCLCCFDIYEDEDHELERVESESLFKACLKIFPR